MILKGDKLRVVGVSRGNEYSPNHIGNDAAIFTLVADELTKRAVKFQYTRKRNLWQRISMLIMYLIWLETEPQ